MDMNAIKQRARDLGAEAVGIGSVERFGQAPEGFHPGDILSGARSVVVFGKEIPNFLSTAKAHAPFTLARNRTVSLLDDIALQLTLEIGQAGGLAIPIPAAEPYEYWDDARRHGRGILSLKHAAEIAGLGRIGKNTLLINEKFGNRLWLGAVVTDLELQPDPPAKQLCVGTCVKCLEACPQSALDGVTIDQKKCREIVGSCSEGGGWYYACFKCRIACPFAYLS
jgi:epoxyqueuosine reductase